MKTAISVLFAAAALCAASAFGQSTNFVGTATFGWNPSPSTGVSEYRLYFSKNPNEWTHVKPVGLSTNATVQLPDFGKWYFIVTARSTNGLESLPSNMVAHDIDKAPEPGSGLRIISSTVTQFGTFFVSTNLIFSP